MAAVILNETELKGYQELVPKNTHVGESKQCVALVKDAMQKKGKTADEAATHNWGKGVKVLENTTKIAPGTLIATFEGDVGGYKSKKTGNHAAIYLGADQTTITVLDQYAGSNGVKPRQIRKKDLACNFDLDFAKKENRPKKPSNNADCFYVIDMK